MNSRILTKQLVVFILLSAVSSRLSSQVFIVSGGIRDSSTGEVLVAATIRVMGSTRGTISNAQGNYRLALPQGEYTLSFSFVGYKTDSTHVRLAGNVHLEIHLVPSPVQMAEVLVTGEDPAIAIMRRVIENKKRWKERLKSYQLDAFTRQVIRRDTAIALISESYSTCYWQQGDTLREVIRQKRQTENIKGTQNFASVGGIINFYDDDIRFSGFTFVGPTSPRTFDYYDFKLERTRQQKGSNIYDIKMIPKSRLVPSFSGSISIVEGSYAVVGIRVKPNEAFIIPYVTELDLSYAQQFALFENEYWMPVDIRINGYVRIGITGLTLPGIGIESISSIYDCRVNPIIPDSIFRKPRRIVLREADHYDSTFWAQRDVLPLTEDEKIAYQRLDSTQKLEKQFQPTGPLVTLGNLVDAAPVSPQFRFNRVEGLFVGASAHLDSLTTRVKITAEGGYGFADKKSKARLAGEFFADDEGHYSFGLEGYQDIRHFSDGNIHIDFDNLFATLLDKIDYFDYYYVKGLGIFVSAVPLNDFSVRTGFRNEEQRSALRHTNYSILAPERMFEPNPFIREGTLKSVWLELRYGDQPPPIPLFPADYLQVRIDHSSPRLGSSFDYTQFASTGEYHFSTFLRTLFLPPSLTLKFSSGAAFGTLSPQSYYHLDSPLIGYAPTGVLRSARIHEFSGDTYFIFTVEHNFRSVPFLLINIPYLYKNSIELLVFGTVAQSWKYPVSAPAEIKPTNGLYGEIGCGVSRILGFFRIDYTYRLVRPQRSVITMGIATLL